MADRRGAGTAQRLGALLVSAHTIKGAVDGHDDAAVQQSVEDGGGYLTVAGGCPRCR
jgi:hypothetical protein